MASDKPDQNIRIHVTHNFKDIDIPQRKLRKLIKIICGHFGTHRQNNTTVFSSNKYEISIAIVDDKDFKKINHKFLKRRTLSDCLSFDLSDNEPGCVKTFELVINGQMALRQAALRGHSSEAELALYITHGLLHNFGFDDLEPSQAKIMHEKEDEILQELGYGFVYNKNMNISKNKKNEQEL